MSRFHQEAVKRRVEDAMTETFFALHLGIVRTVSRFHQGGVSTPSSSVLMET